MRKIIFGALVAFVAIAAPASAAPYKGLLLTQAEVNALPAPPSNVLSAANGTTAPDISNQDNQADVETLAAALVFAKTGTASYKTKVCNNLNAVRGTESGSRALATGRGGVGYVLAYDLIGGPNAACANDSAIQSWFINLRTTAATGGPVSVIACHNDRPNNWGTWCGATRIAIDIEFNQTTDLAAANNVFKGYTGDRSAYAGFSWGDTSWQANPSAPVGINPVGATKSGLNIDGVIPDDARRCGSFSVPPCFSNYVRESLQGSSMQAYLLQRFGFAGLDYQSQAIRRAVDFVYRTNFSDGRHVFDGDDASVPYLINAVYGTNYSTVSDQPGKGWGFASYWGPATTTRAGSTPPPPPPPPPGDTSPPTQPGSLTKTGSTTTSISVNWAASTDNTGVTSYSTFLDGTANGSTAGTTWTFSGLTCGTSYTLGVEANDAATNHSTRANLTASTDVCQVGDQTPPSTPTNVTATQFVTPAGQVGVHFDWNDSTDNVGVDHYHVGLGPTGSGGGFDTTPSQLDLYSGTGADGKCGLLSGTYYVTAYDAAGNHSSDATVNFTCTPVNSGGGTQVLQAAADTGDAGADSGGGTVGLPSTGTAPVLWVDGDQGNPARDVFLKFTVPAGVTSATLKFYSASASSSVITVKSASSSWTESSTTLPAIGSTVATTSAITVGINSVTIPASALPAGGGDVTLVLTRTATSRIDVSSSENATVANRPTLTVVS